MTIATPNLRQILKRLSPGQKRLVLRYARWCLLRQRLACHRPVAFALRTSAVLFFLLACLPVHPLTIPASIGGGLSVALLLEGL